MMLDLPPIDIFSIRFLIALAVVAVAGFMRGYLGVGSGMLMAPVFAIIFGSRDTVAMIIMMDLVVTAQMLPSVYRKIEWRIIAPMGAAAAFCMPFGSWLLVSLDPDLMARGIALVVLVFVVLMMFDWRYAGEKRLLSIFLVGAMSGVLVTATSLGNPPVILYLLSSRDSSATSRANFTGYFAITLVVALTLMVSTGLVTLTAVLHAAVLLPVYMLSAWIGGRYFHKSSEKRYRRVALGLLLCVAVFGILR
jgi:uncharacterized membrane protein YfcA